MMEDLTISKTVIRMYRLLYRNAPVNIIIQIC